MKACSRCTTENPDNNHYCGMCGSILDPRIQSLQEVIGSQIDRQVEQSIKSQTRDRQFVETEITHNILSSIRN